MCARTPVIPYTYAHVIGDTEDVVGLTLSVAPPMMAGEGVREVTVALASPAGITESRVFTVDFKIDEPGGPDCEACWLAGSESWTLPLAD